MKYEIYTGIVMSDNFSRFDFVSLGKKGTIRKRVSFTLTEVEDVYNLAFGDLGEDGEIDDYSVSDNGDRNKVLATVSYIVEAYTNQYPGRWIFFEGSTESRTRLYRMAIGLHLEELSFKFEIYGLVSQQMVPFSKGLEVSGFLITKKKS
jgi:hypothetical protein